MAGFQHGAPGPFAGLDLPWLLEAKARQRREHPFLVWVPADGPTETWSYARFHHEVGRLAAGLARRGIRPGDPVLVHLENGPELLLAYFALAELGAIAVLTDTRAVADELGYFASHSAASPPSPSPASPAWWTAPRPGCAGSRSPAPPISPPCSPMPPTGRAGRVRRRRSACSIPRAPPRAPRAWSGPMPMRSGRRG